MFLENISAPQDANWFSSRRLFTLQVSRVSCINNASVLAGEVIWLDNYGHVGCLLHFDWLRTATLANKLWPSEWRKTWENHENPQESYFHGFEPSLCTDVPPLSGKIWRGDVVSSPDFSWGRRDVCTQATSNLCWCNLCISNIYLFHLCSDKKYRTLSMQKCKAGGRRGKHGALREDHL